MSTTIQDTERYRTIERLDWSARDGLVDDERFLVENYLDPSSVTLEAGTGNGRIVFALKDLGFTSLHGFDLMPEFVEAARVRDTDGGIVFDREDATSLSYPDSTFEQLIYLAQIISTVGSWENQLKLLNQAFRVARPGALLLVSFLSWDTRLSRPVHLLYTGYLKAHRTMFGSRVPLQSQPWLKLGEWANLGALVDSPPYLHYFKLHEISELIRLSGWNLIEIGSTCQISRRQPMCPNIIELAGRPIRGAVFAVCSKP